MPVWKRPRALASLASIVLVVAMAPLLARALSSHTIVDVILAAVVVGALAALYALRGYARKRLIYDPARRERQAAARAADRGDELDRDDALDRAESTVRR